MNQTGWQQVLENNKQNFFSGFVQRSRFSSAYPTSLSPDQFVDQLFLNAGVTASGSDRQAAINEFGGFSTTTDIAARARVLRRVAENSTLAQQEFNRAFVLMQYFGYLRRNPNDAPDSDFGGFNFWLDKLNQFKGNYIEAQMVKAFLDLLNIADALVHENSLTNSWDFSKKWRRKRFSGAALLLSAIDRLGL